MHIQKYNWSFIKLVTFPWKWMKKILINISLVAVTIFSHDIHNKLFSKFNIPYFLKLLQHSVIYTFILIKRTCKLSYVHK